MQACKKAEVDYSESNAKPLNSNEAFNNPENYPSSNLKLMQKGLAPRSNECGMDVLKKIHHINGRNIPNSHNQDNLLPVWPWEHADIDPYRYYTGERP